MEKADDQVSAEQEEIKPDPEALVLVGFGKHDLATVLSWRGTSKEEDAIMAPTKWPPRYRPNRMCEPGQVDLFAEYVSWISNISYKDFIAF